MSQVEPVDKAIRNIERDKDIVEYNAESDVRFEVDNCRPSWPSEALDDSRKISRHVQSRRVSLSALQDIQRTRHPGDFAPPHGSPLPSRYRKKASLSVQAIIERRSRRIDSFEMGEITPTSADLVGTPLSEGSGSAFPFPSVPAPAIGFRDASSLDSVSAHGRAGNTDRYNSTSHADSRMRSKTKENLTSLMSIIYAFFVVSLCTIFPLLPSVSLNHIADNLYTIFNCVVGIGWLLFLQVDISLYKRRIVRRIKEKLKTIDNRGDSIPTSPDAILRALEQQDWDEEDGYPLYRFQRGRHSGSFFLKIGMTVFCFGHLIYEGLTLAKTLMTADLVVYRIHLYLTVHVLKPIYSFYQLFMVFKYSHVIINHYPSLARFGLMHLISTSISSWLRSIILDAESSHKDEGHNCLNDTSVSTVDDAMFASTDASVVLSQFNLIYHLYPFTIEFSIIIAGVWFIMWLNIGDGHHHKASETHLEPTLQETEGGDLDLTYRSQLVISADCHSANKGIFAGLGALLFSIVTVILFYVLIESGKDDNSIYREIALIIYCIQEVSLSGVALITVALAFLKTSSLSFNPAPITFLDDCLLVVPIPFFFVNTALNVIAESFHADGTVYRAGVLLLQLLQVLLQTPMLIDGLRRCSLSPKQRYKKPGRELVTFLIIINLAMWVVFTFEQKKADTLVAAPKFFGDRWLYIGHTTVPLMLFYRFHSAVCFADIWKSAYEKEED